MERTGKLVDLLKRLNAGADPQTVKAEARELLSSIGPEELSLAEQKLVESGLDPRELRSLCEVHMELLGDEAQRIKGEVPPGHVVHTLISEHEMILAFLDELEGLNQRIRSMKAYESSRDEFAHLRHIAEHLVESEPHHQREEEVLFPELEKLGLTGPPNIMRMEHEMLRPQKEGLKELAESVADMDFDDFQRKLDAAANFIVPTLREHIFKENNILYPTAVRLIKDEELWDRMKEDCDRVGYCCFTPEQ